MEFSVGSTVIVPVLGAGLVTEVKELLIGGGTYEVYVITMLSDGATYTVPTSKAVAKGVRPVLTPEQVVLVYAMFREKPEKEERQTWNRRQRVYMDTIQAGDPIKVADILRGFARLRTDKILSFGERRLYMKVMEFVVQELALAQGISGEEVRREIETIFASYGETKRVSEKSLNF